ncbi:MAG TPA: Cas8a1 family CRISPR/Cas system-associated protein, partial [Clostridia bacterium]|nr:Cas8a1 family CRISPR/Cas system-associated protein [Clostridia bacterium]
MKIRINTGDWMLTMGMVGFHRVYNYGLAHNIIPENGNDLLKIHSIGFELNPDIFKYLPQAYFSYMLAEHSIYEREQERLRKSMGFAGKEENFNDALGNVKRIINDNTKKIVRYFPEEVTGRLDAAQTKLKEIKKFDQYSELKNCVSEFLEVAKLQEVDEKLTLNFVKAVILRPFFGQPSFINVSKNNLTLQEQIKLFRDDYVQPVLLELDFQECVDGAKDKKEILAFLEERKNYKPFATFLRQFKKLKYDEIKDIVENQTPQCSLLQNLPAYRNYEEMIFSPLGISTNKALNFQWKQNKNLPTPISSLAKLVLFCAPAGCALYGRWEGRGGQGEYRTYAGFVQAEGAFSDTIRRNNSFKNQKDKNDPFDKILGVLIEDLRQKAGHILEHLFFVEFFSDYESKKTALEYYHLPRFLAHYIKAHGKQLEKVTPRERFVRSVLLGQDPIYAVWSHLKWLIGKNHYTFGCYLAVRE